LALRQIGFPPNLVTGLDQVPFNQGRGRSHTAWRTHVTRSDQPGQLIDVLAEILYQSPIGFRISSHKSER
jgi:hypothetical protein